MAMQQSRIRIALAVACGAVLAIVIAKTVELFTAPQQQPAFVSISDHPYSGPFALTATDGRRVTDANLKRRPHAVFFGFTHCPDICPTTLQRLTILMERMGRSANNFVPLFIAIDWERDTPEALKSYLSSFDKRIVGLTGTEKEIFDAAKALKVHVKRVPDDHGDYTMEHTVRVLLIGLDGRLQGTVDLHQNDAVVLEKLNRLARLH